MSIIIQYTPLISLFITLFTFLVLYWRENSKQFQDKIFEYKYLSYKEIITELGIYNDKISSLQQHLQHFEGSKEEWETHYDENCKEWFDEAFELDKLKYKHGLVLPENLYERLVEITSFGIRAVTTHHHFNNEMAINIIDKYWELYMGFIQEARQDLKIEKLDTSLKQRLSEPFYPIKSPFKNGT